MSRDPIKVITHRASKIPIIQEFLDDITNKTVDDIDALDIKRSDKKLLYTHFKRIRKHCKEESLLGYLNKVVEKMPKHEVKEQIFDVFVYDGFDTTYDGLEIPTGTIVTEGEDWIRFDFYRIKKKENTTTIKSNCQNIGQMTLTDLNRFIQKTINERHGGPSSRDWREAIRIG